jgi:hypothetical protein
VSAFAPLAAQVAAELKMRLRSAATPIALVVFFAAAFFWIPDPHGHSASLTWDLPDGRVQAPLYSSGYVGFALAILSSVILAMGGFYLVAGSVRRDRERGIGAILVATPLSKPAYLGGKFAAHLAYLVVLDLMALGAGIVAFVYYGTGRFDPIAFAGPFLFLTVPALVAVSALAVFFDVTPGLRGRGGLVLWFFVFLFGLVKLPMDLAGMEVDTPGRQNPMSRPIFDPAGLATDGWLTRQSLPPGALNISTGHITREEAIERVPWKGVTITPDVVGLRAVNLLFALLPLGLAVVVFDRFDPSRGRRRARRSGLFQRFAGKLRGRVFASVPDAQGPAPVGVRLSPVTVRPSQRAAILAEARLTWESASFVKWPLVLAAMLAGLTPGNFSQALFLLLLVPVISEASAREELAGTAALVFSQPAVPKSPSLWKAAAIALIVLALGAPLAVRSALVSPGRGLACIGGLLAVAAISVGLGALSGGGKLFTGVYLVVWYMGLSNLSAADPTSTLSARPEPAYALLYMGLGAILLAAAFGRERARASAA